MIKKRLEEIGKSMYELARDIGESDQRTQYIVKKKEFAKDFLLLKRISASLGCDIEDLLTEDEKNQLKDIESKRDKKLYISNVLLVCDCVIPKPKDAYDEPDKYYCRDCNGRISN